MGNSRLRIVLHTVFSTKFRHPTLTPTVEPALLEFMSETLVENGARVIEINGGLDHVHIVHTLPSTLALADLMQRVKGSSSHWVSRAFPETHSKFRWQGGYACHSVNYREYRALRRYVREQKARHGLEGVFGEGD